MSGAPSRTERFPVGDLTVVAHVTDSVEVPRRAVVLVHGVGSSARAFRTAIPRLVPYGDVHAVDLPGFGSSPRPNRDVPVADHAALVAAYVRERILGAGLPAPVLVGHSMGTQVVGQILAQFPDAASAGILVGPTAEPGSRSFPRQAARLARDAVGEPPAAMAVLLVDALVRCRFPYYLAQLRHVVAHRLEDVVPLAVAPVVVVRGRRDPVAGEPWVEELARLAPRGEHRTLRGRHHAMDSDPGGLVALVIEAWQAAGRGAR
ncbi:alpha/beta fold hydrolase [Antribacter gilvus]|uniref:alpha/beta fold hydrolase n=1 Tax=Antribacter gilvus TaxID=2304675 RepID=UPI0013E07E6E|nr:alpha/beta hydrolase family protein [Antribacter gilvus]